MHQYSPQIVAAFKAVVVAHAVQHNYNDYLRELFKRQGAQVNRRLMPLKEAITHDILFGEWMDEHVCDSSLPFSAWFDFSAGTAEQIGEIDSQPVYFNRTAGIYGYADSPNSKCVLELWLTSPHYPPGW